MVDPYKNSKAPEVSKVTALELCCQKLKDSGKSLHKDLPDLHYPPPQILTSLELAGKFLYHHRQFLTPYGPSKIYILPDASQDNPQPLQKGLFYLHKSEHPEDSPYTLLPSNFSLWIFHNLFL